MNRKWLRWGLLLLIMACVFIAVISYTSEIHCTVKVIDQQGNPVPDTRVLVLHDQGGSNSGAFFGVADDNGEVVFSRRTWPHPFGSLGLRAISADNRIGSAKGRHWTRRLTIRLRSRTAEERKYYQYDKAGDLWMISPVVKREIDWSIEPGIGEYVPVAELEHDEQKRLRNERQGGRR